jgi:hypothetical protein
MSHERSASRWRCHAVSLGINHALLFSAARSRSVGGRHERSYDRQEMQDPFRPVSPESWCSRTSKLRRIEPCLCLCTLGRGRQEQEQALHLRQLKRFPLTGVLFQSSWQGPLLPVPALLLSLALLLAVGGGGGGVAVESATMAATLMLETRQSGSLGAELSISTRHDRSLRR